MFWGYTSSVQCARVHFPSVDLSEVDPAGLCIPSFFKFSDISLVLFVSTFCYPEDIEN